MNDRGCYDLDVGGTTFRTGLRWLRSCVSLGKSEMGEIDGVTKGSIVVECFS